MPLASMGEGGGDEGGHHPPTVLAGMGQGVAGEVHPAALPGGMEQLGDGRLEAIVGVGNDQFDATETALPELAQEGGPEGFCLRVADVHRALPDPPEGCQQS